MSDSAEEPLGRRLNRLHQLLCGNDSTIHNNPNLVNPDGLLDALIALYEECNSPHVANDHYINLFLEKAQKLVDNIQWMRVKVSDFELRKIIGQGLFGPVRIVKEKVTGDIYAMKVQNKEETISQDNMASYEEERNIMASATSPWITKLQYAFQSSKNLYLIMEFHQGGDLQFLLKKYKQLPEDWAQFYLAELILAINTLHNMGYVHRDIKPENVLLDRMGHIKLADFGSSSKLSIERQVTTKVVIKSPDYVAPEVLSSINDTHTIQKTYGIECDWWSLGVLAYEVLSGILPFADKETLIVYHNIMNHKKSLSFPMKMSRTFKHLIQNLLTDASQRYGYKELIQHKVFEKVDWEDIRQSVPPYIPSVSSPCDTSNFKYFKEDTCPFSSTFQCTKNCFGKSLPFIGYTYNAPLELLRKSSPAADSPHNACSTAVNEKQKSVKPTACSSESDNPLAKENMKLKRYIRKQEETEKELNKLLLLEREERVSRENKMCQIIKCMKIKMKNSGKFSKDQLEGNDFIDDYSVPLIKKLEEEFLSLAESSDERQNFVTFVGRSQAFSPYFSRLISHTSKSPRAHSRAAVNIETDETSMLHEKYRKLQKELEERDFQIESMGHTISSLEQDLKIAEEVRYRAVVEEPKDKVILKVSKMEDEISTKERLIAELELQILKEMEKYECLKTELQEKTNELKSALSFKSDLECNLKTAQSEMLGLKIQNDVFQQALEVLKERNSLESSQCSSERSEIQSELYTIYEKFESLTHTLELQEENNKLKNSIARLEREIDELKSAVGVKNNLPENSNLEKLLKKKDEALSIAKSNLKLITQEKMEAEDLVSGYRESNRELRNELDKIRDKLAEKANIEVVLNTKIKSLEDTVEYVKENCTDKIKSVEIENARLEAKLSVMQDLSKSQKDINQICAKSQDRFDGLQKQNEKLKYEIISQENGKTKLLSEVKTIKAELEKEKQKRLKYEETTSFLKNVCAELEDQLKKFDELEGANENDFACVKQMNYKLKNENKRLHFDLARSSDLCNDKDDTINKLTLEVDSLEKELENQQDTYKLEVSHLQIELNNQRRTIQDLEDQLCESKGALSNLDQNKMQYARIQRQMEKEVVQMKEEASDLITQLSSMKLNNSKLTESLKSIRKKEKDARKVIDEMKMESEKCQAENSKKNVQMEETISQQIKLIEFLQMKVESLEKKKVGLMPRVFGKKEAANCEAQFSMQELEKERTKCHVLQEQLCKARAEIMQLKSQCDDKSSKAPKQSCSSEDTESADTISFATCSSGNHEGDSDFTFTTSLIQTLENHQSEVSSVASYETDI